MLINGVNCDGIRGDGSPRPECRFPIGIVTRTVAMDAKLKLPGARNTPMARDDAEPKTSSGPADVIVRLIKAMRDMGATDDEIIAAIAGDAPIAQDNPPRPPGTPIAPSDRAAYPGLTVYPYPKDQTTAMDEALFRTRWPDAPAIGIDYRPIEPSHRVSPPSAAADFHARYPDAARLG